MYVYIFNLKNAHISGQVKKGRELTRPGGKYLRVRYWMYR